MALKKTLTEEQFKKLKPEVADHYKKDGDSYTLEAEGFDDGAELKRALENERREHKETKKAAKDFETKFIELSTTHEEALKSVVPKTQFDALEKSYKDKYEGEFKKKDDVITKTKGQLTSILVDGEAMKLAAKISTVPGVMLPHIKNRLRAEEVEGQIKTRILDKDGNPSALTFDDLEKEFLASKDFAPILVGSKASGGGAQGQQGGGGAHSGKTISRSTFETLSQMERVTFAKDGGQVTDS